MVLLLNGSFGIGNTTVSRLLRARMPRSRIFDPERVGYVLRRLPAWAPLSTSPHADYQDARQWRRLTASFARASHSLCRVLIVPMTFSNPAYLAEIRDGFRAAGIAVRHVCLTASEAVIRARLRARGLDFASAEARWVLPRVRSCCQAHAGPEFADQLATDDLGASEVAEQIVRRVVAARPHGR